MDGSAPVTMMLRELREGRAGARERLADVVYGELRALASSMMAQERASHTLQPTALVHEAYVRLASGAGADARDRGHFMAIAAKVMRQVLIDHARAKRADKRGGGRVFAGLAVGSDGIGLGGSGVSSGVSGGGSSGEEASGLDVLDLDEALVALAEAYPRAARVVELRFFGGLGVADVAMVMEVAEPTVERDWALARGWLQRRMSGGDGSSGRGA